jgi:hypothetical protein
MQTPVVSRYPALAPVHDFVLLFLPPCGPPLTPWPPGSSSQAYLSLHSSEALQGIDLSRPLFTCTNANQAATCTCNTRPRVNPHHVVNHSSQPRAIIHRSLDAPVLNLHLMSALTTRTSNQFKEKRKRKEMKEKLKQVIKSQTKAKKRSLERSWSPRARATTRHNRDKMLQICRLLKVRQKGSTPSTKEHN